MTPAQLFGARIALDYAKKRWPNANSVTQPQLMAEIERLKAMVARGVPRPLAEAMRHRKFRGPYE
jgi:hypothetical protein